jgi:hypothetical protein
MAKGKARTQPGAAPRRSAAQVARVVLGVLVALNLAAAWLVVNPPGGSAEALEQDLVRMQAQLKQARMRLEESQRYAASLEAGRSAAEEFLARYFVTRRTLPTTLLSELDAISRRAGIRDRGSAFSIELIEGSENLGMVTITANFEGAYRNLLNFVREIDRSPHLLIIESLTAAPQQGSNVLMVAMKMQGFLREDGMFPEPAPLQQASLAPEGRGE